MHSTVLRRSGMPTAPAGWLPQACTLPPASRSTRSRSLISASPGTSYQHSTARSRPGPLQSMRRHAPVARPTRSSSNTGPSGPGRLPASHRRPKPAHWRSSSPCPSRRCTGRAPWISKALSAAPPGASPSTWRQRWRSTAAAPATTPVDIEVPPRYWYQGSGFARPQPRDGLTALRAAARLVPGAHRSGLMRPSSVGPQLDSSASRSASPETGAPRCTGSGKRVPSGSSAAQPPRRPIPASGPSVAPTASTFFALAGAYSVPASMAPSRLRSRPALPAATITSIPGWACRKWSHSQLSSV